MSRGKNTLLPKDLHDGIQILGDSWVLCIIGTLAKGEMRFCEIQRALDNVNPTTLAERLKRLENEKIIQRQEETRDKISVVYSLTEKGVGILPILQSIQQFAETFL